METIDAIYQRRSIKHYDPEHQLIAIGKGTKEAWPKPGQLPLDELVVENGF